MSALYDKMYNVADVMVHMLNSINGYVKNISEKCYAEYDHTSIDPLKVVFRYNVFKEGVIGNIFIGYIDIIASKNCEEVDIKEKFFV